ncbi:MAG: FYDLN acid domain-containing protein [Deltaproteobacteria bacterium]|nr:FYDLN acid domain-containing protein [Deltaproteobacteria bacterium]MCB9786063.1 FYDLN acid domain-containing protein [Deltaproteobacteria bacterium]
MGAMTGRAIAVKDYAKFGRKRLCADCGTRFYDFGQSEAHCPKCGAVPVDEPERFRIEDHLVVEDDDDTPVLVVDEDLDDTVDLDDTEELLGDDDAGDDDAAEGEDEEVEEPEAT